MSSLRCLLEKYMISGVCQNVMSRHRVDGIMEMVPLGGLCGDLESFEWFSILSAF